MLPITTESNGANTASYNGTDTQTATNYSYNDNYSGSANGVTSYSLSEAGQYSNQSWAVSRFTESESTVTNASP